MRRRQCVRSFASTSEWRCRTDATILSREFRAIARARSHTEAARRDRYGVFAGALLRAATVVLVTEPSPQRTASSAWRVVFLTTALGGLACASEPTRAKPAAWPVVRAPAGASPEMTLRYRALATQVEEVRGMLGRITAATDACGRAPTTDACTVAVEDAGKAVNELHVLLTSMRYVCKSDEPDKQALEKLSNEQVDFAGERLEEAAAEIERVVGDPFEQARERADRANPVPAPHYHCHGHW